MKTAVGEEASRFVGEHRNAGAYLLAGEGRKTGEAIIYRYLLDGDAPAVVDDNRIVAEKDSEITVVAVYSSGDETPVFHGGLTRIIAKENAVVRLIQVQMLNDTSIHFSDVGVTAGDGARVEVTQLELGANRALAGCYAELRGRGSAVDIDTVYFADGVREMDFNYVARHTGIGSASNITANGALFGSAGKIYRGTIDFHRGASAAVGHEREHTLLFSPDARGRSAPLILCGEENVEGRHAATIGRIDEAKLFYMQARGISPAKAKRLLVEAQLSGALSKIPDEGLRAQIEKHIAEKLEAL
jgi:Fe-S cluster assembly scaffold protein SufB